MRFTSMLHAIDAEGSNNIPTDLEEEARAVEANGASIDREKTGIKIRFKVPKQQSSDEEADSNMESSEPSHGKASSNSTSATSEQHYPENSNLIEEDGESSEVGSSRSHNCPECEKSFPSLKSLYGHLRSHPNRGYRGVKPPQSIRSKRAVEDSVDQSSVLSRTPKRTRSGYYDTKEFESAMTLILISRGLQSTNAYEINQKLDKKPNLTTSNRRNGLGSASTSKYVPAKKFYKCSICTKSFSTHQALGGHMASHNKNKHSLEVEAEDVPTHVEDGDDQDGATTKSVGTVHKCEKCGKTFGSGQALGGHKRMHYAENHSGPSAMPSETIANSRKQALNDFDLNKLPRFEDEEEI